MFLAAVGLTAGLFAQVPIKWDCETSRVASQPIEAYHGETVQMQVTLRSYGQPVILPPDATATLYWTTNSAAGFWPKPATAIGNKVIADWTPECDTGADSYTFYIAVGTAAGISYRVNGTIKLRPSPGFQPAALPPAETFPGLEEWLAPKLAAALPTPDDYPGLSEWLDPKLAGVTLTLPAPGDYPGLLVYLQDMLSAYQKTSTNKIAIVQNTPALITSDSTLYGATTNIFVWDASEDAYVRVPQLDLAFWRVEAYSNELQEVRYPMTTYEVYNDYYSNPTITGYTTMTTTVKRAYFEWRGAPIIDQAYIDRGSPVWSGLWSKDSDQTVTNGNQKIRFTRGYARKLTPEKETN